METKSSVKQPRITAVSYRGGLKKDTRQRESFLNECVTDKHAALMWDVHSALLVDLSCHGDMSQHICINLEHLSDFS